MRGLREPEQGDGISQCLSGRAVRLGAGQDPAGHEVDGVQASFLRYRVAP